MTPGRSRTGRAPRTSHSVAGSPNRIEATADVEFRFADRPVGRDEPQSHQMIVVFDAVVAHVFRRTEGFGAVQPDRRLIPSSVVST